MSNRTINVTPNYSKRTFTIRVKYIDGDHRKYRTSQMSKAEFEENTHNTRSDWEYFLAHGEYSKAN